MDSAKNLVERFTKELLTRPVWLFSSGPVGDPPKPDEDPVDVAEIVATTGAREHRLFAGKVDTAMLGLGEKVILKAVRVPEGDYRPWDGVKAWAQGIAVALKASNGRHCGRSRCGRVRRRLSAGGPLRAPSGPPRARRCRMGGETARWRADRGGFSP